MAQIKYYSEHLNRHYPLYFTALYWKVFQISPVAEHSGNLIAKTKGVPSSYYTYHEIRKGKKQHQGNWVLRLMTKTYLLLRYGEKNMKFYFSEKMLKIVFYSWSRRNKIVTFYKLF